MYKSTYCKKKKANEWYAIQKKLNPNDVTDITPNR